MEYFYLIILGIGAGLISSYFGIGGAALIVPVLYAYFPQIEAPTVIGSALGVILLNAIYNSFLFFKSGIRFERKIYVPLIPTIVLGALAGTQLTFMISDLWLKRIFAIVLVLVIIRVLFFKAETTEKGTKTPDPWKGAIIGFVVGIVTGLTGLGGGTILTPTFLTIYNMPAKLVPAYNNLLMIVASSSALMHFVITPSENEAMLFQQYQLGQMNAAIVLIIFLGSLFSAHWGVKLNKMTSDENKRYFFAILLALMAIQILVKTL